MGNGRRAGRGDVLSAQPPGRARPADRRAHLGRRAQGRRGLRARSPGGAVRGSAPQLVRRRARHALRALSLRRVRRAAPAADVGSDRWNASGARGCRPRGRGKRRHHPRSRSVRRVPGDRGAPRLRRGAGGGRRPEHWRRRRRQAAAGRRARRGDGVRVAGGRGVRARRLQLAHRGDHPGQGDGQPGARRAGEDAVLARRPARTPAGVRDARRATLPRAGAHAEGEGALAAAGGRARRAGSVEPAAVPARPGGCHRRGPQRRDGDRRALRGRGRRLARVRADPVRRARACALDHRRRAPAGAGPRPGSGDDVDRRRHGLPRRRNRRAARAGAVLPARG